MAPQPTIPFIDLFTEEKEKVLEDVFDEIRSVVRKSQFILGDAVAHFENEFAKLSGCDYGVGVNSGLDALILSLRAFKIGPGDEVITAPNSYIASAAAIALVGAKPVFVDIREDYNLNPNLIEKALTKHTKAIMPVHLTGLPADMKPILEIAKLKNLKILEDSAQAVGAVYHGQKVGSFGNTGCFSLHPLKNLHVWGDGGMITTNDKALADHLRLQRNHGHRTREDVEFFSFNSRLDTVQAVVGSSSLRMLEKTTHSRARHAAIYDDRLSSVSEFVAKPTLHPAGVTPVWHIYQVAVRDREKLRAFLSDRGIETKIHYPIPIHWQKAAAYLGYKRGDFPVADRLAGEILSLPVRENLSDDEVHRICDAVSEFYLQTRS